MDGQKAEVLLGFEQNYRDATQIARGKAAERGAPVDVRWDDDQKAWGIYGVDIAALVPMRTSKISPANIDESDEVSNGKPGDYRPDGSEVCYICSGRGSTSYGTTCSTCQGFGYLRMR